MMEAYFIQQIWSEWLVRVSRTVLGAETATMNKTDDQTLRHLQSSEEQRWIKRQLQQSVIYAMIE